MGHACEILTFKETTKKSTIIAECNQWANYNHDPYEGGDGLPCSIKFTNHKFDTYEEAKEYLDNHSFGDYGEKAVLYKHYINVKPPKKINALNSRIEEYNKKINVLNKPHFMNVKSATIKCKCCGSSLATAYCGKSWYNTCPICKTELRPATTLDKIAKYKETIKDLQKQIKEETRKIEAKTKFEWYWAVACEVHC